MGTKKKLVGVTAGSYDPARTYQIHVSRRVVLPDGVTVLRPAHNPYTVTGVVAVAIADAIKPDAVVEISD
jgi:hypothetical protein